MTIRAILDRVRQFGTQLVLVTGGEPLLQEGCLDLLSGLCDDGYDVLLETGGHKDISPVDPRVIRILDLKCPSSGESEKNRYGNIDLLRPTDEVKFVIADRTDYDWAKATVERLDLSGRCKVLFSPVSERLEPHTLAEWVLDDRLPVRFQLQLHKILWPEKKRGV
jgi:7-carboxy-7-deazaguanine synthase